MCSLYLQHRFDLLGSGWQSVSLASKNREKWLKDHLPLACIPYATTVWQMVSAGYRPIDWQLDFKSGYRWSERTWYMDIPIGHKAGVDVKVPWELARMQHLPQLAIAYAYDRNDRYWQEYCDEILDFIAQNPPRFGVNWRCTMDVGIRIANWLLAYDIFVGQGVKFSEDFEQVLARSVYDHAYHIVHNLEYSPQLTTNHYLSDIAGLLFATAHLENTTEISKWLAFSQREIISEMKREFHGDGSNFEASTSYHCLSTELMLHSALLIKRLPRELQVELPEWFWCRLVRAVGFVEKCSIDGVLQQIGDADSGHFFKLAPRYHKLTKAGAYERYQNLAPQQLVDDVYYDEDMQNHEEVLSYRELLPFADDMQEVKNAGDLHEVWKHLRDAWSDSGRENVYHIADEHVNLLLNLHVYAYTGMGLYIWKSDRLHLIVRCGEVGQNGSGGHSHNDQLSLTLTLDGKTIIADPGSYLYTPDPVMRNKFRGTAMHFTPQPMSGIEQNEWVDGQRGLFSIKKDRTNAQVLYVGRDGIIMRHDGFGTPVWRVVEICSDGIVVTDYGVNLKRWKNPGVFSNGYGKLLKL
ncbi:heparinase II/III family protein [Selenomonas ruminis]|uniref:heparinase II/III family protein n=1 Tax=Selenomonas ruminis TaxID=2593411 RepID=UPI0016559ACF|nr:heparinase II/III family protein [Selenomonas sp. mPRGC5]